MPDNFMPRAVYPRGLMYALSFDIKRRLDNYDDPKEIFVKTIKEFVKKIERFEKCSYCNVKW